MVTKPPPKFLSRAVLLGSILRLRRIDHAELLQLDHRRTDQLPLSLPSINLVDRAHFCKQISGVQRISEESWQVLAKYPWRAARGFQRQEGGGALIRCEEMSAASKNSYMSSDILIVGVAFFKYVIFIFLFLLLYWIEHTRNYQVPHAIPLTIISASAESFIATPLYI